MTKYTGVYLYDEDNDEYVALENADLPYENEVQDND